MESNMRGLIQMICGGLVVAYASAWLMKVYVPKEPSEQALLVLIILLLAGATFWPKTK